MELTKLHEEYHRGTLKEHCGLHDLKGEMVVIVEGDTSEKEVSMEDLLKEMDLLIEEGQRAKDAAKTVSEKYEVSKNQLYQAYLKEGNK